MKIAWTDDQGSGPYVAEFALGADLLPLVQTMGMVEHYVNLVPRSVEGTAAEIAALDEYLPKTTAQYLVNWRERWTEVLTA